MAKKKTVKKITVKAAPVNPVIYVLYEDRRSFKSSVLEASVSFDSMMKLIPTSWVGRETQIKQRLEEDREVVLFADGESRIVISMH